MSDQWSRRGTAGARRPEGSRPLRFADPFWLVFLMFAGVPWFGPQAPGAGLLADPGRVDRVRWSLRTACVSVVPPLIRMGAITCMIVGLARPQTAGEQVRISGRGRGDRAGGRPKFEHEDDRLHPRRRQPSPNLSRLDAAKETLGLFLEARTDDLIGVVAFANLPDTVAPPTLDRRFTWQAIRAVKPAGAADDGTDIGGAIAWALGMLRPVPTQRKVLILLTDGRHAPGATTSLDPLVAAEVARGLGVTLHTVAVGKPHSPPPPVPATGGNARPGPADSKPAPQPGPKPLPVGDKGLGSDEGPDLDLLRRLAERGNGRAFVATDLEALAEIFGAIDQLETSPVQGTIQTIYSDHFAPWVAAALALVAVDLTLGMGLGRRFP